MLNELAEEIHYTAREHGWWDEDAVRSFGELIALVHSEASEALEAYRERIGADVTKVHYTGPRMPESMKPEGVPIELADVIIRVLDMCAWYGIDIDSAVQEKMRYNETRSFRHGGKAI